MIRSMPLFNIGRMPSCWCSCSSFGPRLFRLSSFGYLLVESLQFWTLVLGGALSEHWDYGLWLVFFHPLHSLVQVGVFMRSGLKWWGLKGKFLWCLASISRIHWGILLGGPKCLFIREWLLWSWSLIMIPYRPLGNVIENDLFLEVKINSFKELFESNGILLRHYHW